MTTILPPTLIKTKAEGERLLKPLRAALDDLTVTTAEEYAEADQMLARVRAARQQWMDRMEEILAPLRKAKVSADALKREVDRPLEQLETDIKGKMRDFKIQEQAELDRQRRLTEQAQATLAQQIEETSARELAARTPQLRERLAARREELEAHAAEVEADAPVETKGAHSATRRVKRWRIVDTAAAMKAHPEVFVVSTVMVNQVPLDTVAQWPGFEVYEDVIITGRG